jgi:4-amino-4-deoxy-L-arabinose transferase-like glycosyltransferase
MKKETPFFVFLLGVFLLLISPNLLTHGMFMDGMIYAAVAKNMADGIGTFWQPFFTATCYSEFYEHPPLAMGLLGVCYKIFGDSFLVEKLYSFSMWLIVAVGLVNIWRHFKLKNAWLPVLMLMTVTRIIWASTNNGLENTLAVFVIFSVWFYLKSTTGKWWYIVLSGVCIAAGFLTKGPFALFLWTLPFFYEFLVYRNNLLRALVASLKLVVLTVFPLFLLYFFSEAAFQNLDKYLHIQVVESLKNVETVSSRFFILRYFLAEMILPAALLLLVLLISFAKRRKFDIDSDKKRLFYAFFLTGLCGVVPIMVSMKQSGFYILPTFPIFALSFSFLLERVVGKWIAQLTKVQSFHRVAWMLASAVLLIAVFMNLRVYGEVGRDADKLQDVHHIAAQIQDEKVVGVPKALWIDWSLQAYFHRYYGIALDGNQEHEHLYYIFEENQLPDDLNWSLERISEQTLNYHLYKNTFVE